jgi:hypothetical protein
MKHFFTQKSGRNVLLRGIRFLAVVMFLSFVSTEAAAQCDNTLNFGQWGSATAPTSGSATFSTCNYYGEYSPLNGVAANTIYTCQIAAGGYVTVYQGTANGTLIANGTSPLSWTSTVAGTYYVHWNSNAACGTAFSCNTTSVTYVGPGSGCTNPVIAGTIVAPSAACSGSPTTLTLAGASTGTGLSYNWYSSTNGTTFGASIGTNASISVSQTVATYYYCEVVCSGGAADYTDTVLIDINPFYNCYCGSSAGSTDDTKIQEFEFSTTSTSSAQSTCETYTDYTNLPTPDVFQGNTYPARVQNGDCSPGTVWGATAYVWIDYNQSGSFDASEQTIVGTYTTNGVALYTNLIADITIPLTSQTGITGMRVMLVEGGVSGSCATYNWGETEDYLVNILPPPANDVGIAEINSPAFPACSFDSTICVTLSNGGTDTLFSADVSYSINGGAVTTFSWTGMIPPTSTDTACVEIGTVNFNAGDSLLIVASMPNGLTGTYFLNDSMAINDMNLSLQGTYAIPGDYTTFTDAVDAMMSYGVCDHVIFEAANGTYEEQIVIPSILGAGPNATITFTSANADSSLVILTDSTTTAASNYVVMFDGADYVTFSNMTIENTGPTYSRVFHYQGGSDYNTLTNNVIKGAAVNSGTGNDATLVYSQTPASSDNYNTFANNRFQDGETGLWLLGTSTTNAEMSNTVENNQFINQYRAGSIMAYNNNAVITGNTVTSNSGYTGNSYGLDCEYCDFVEISYNHIYSDGNDWPVFGLFSYFSTGTLSNPIEIYNNLISIGDSSAAGTSQLRGAYIYALNSAYVENNTFTIMGGSATSVAAYVYEPGGIIMENNLLSNLNDGVAMDVAGVIIADFDYNNYFNSDPSGAIITYAGAPFTNVQGFNNAHPQYEVNGFSINPEFNDTINGLICNDVLDGQGKPYMWLSDDLNNVTRSIMPDLGAVEYFAPENFSLSGDTVCGSEYVVDLNGPVSSVTWSVNGAQTTGQSVTLTTGSTPSNINVEVSFSSVCATSTVTASADFRLIPDVQLDSALHLCADDVATLTPGGGGTASYLWYPTNETSSSIQISEGGIYSVSKNEEGCMSQATIAVSESDGVDLQNAEVCAGDLPYQVDATIVGGQSYSWSEGSSTATVDLNTTGVYFVTVTDNQGCSSSDSIFFEAIDIPTVGFTETHSGYVYYFNSGNSANVGSSASYAWSFGDGSAISTDANPTHQYPWASPSTPAVYITTLTITNACGTNNKSMEIMPDPVGINELGNSISYNVYPNPSNGFVNVEFTGTVAEQASLRVMDISGRLVSESSANTNDIVTLNLSSVASGTYILEVSIDGAVSQTRISIQ